MFGARRWSNRIKANVSIGNNLVDVQLTASAESILKAVWGPSICMTWQQCQQHQRLAQNRAAVPSTDQLQTSWRVSRAPIFTDLFWPFGPSPGRPFKSFLFIWRLFWHLKKNFVAFHSNHVRKSEITQKFMELDEYSEKIIGSSWRDVQLCFWLHSDRTKRSVTNQPWCTSVSRRPAFPATFLADSRPNACTDPMALKRC